MDVHICRINNFIILVFFFKYPASVKLFNSFLTELVDSPNSFANEFK